MALAFMLNPAANPRRKRKRRATRTGRRPRSRTRTHRAKRRPKWLGKKVKNMTYAQCMAASKARGRRYKCRTRKDRRAIAAARRGRGTVRTGASSYGDALGVIQTNPRKRKRRGKKGGRKMAKRSRKRRTPARTKSERFRKRRGGARRRGRRTGWSKSKRARAGRKAWRTRLRRYPKYKSSRKRRGYRNNPSRSRRRRRNMMAVRGGMYSNPRRRRRGRRRKNMLQVRGMYSNPRRRGRRRARRNPFSLGGTFKSVTRRLTDPKSLMQFAVAAAGGTVSGLAGAWIEDQVAGFSPVTFAPGSTARRLLAAVARIASGVLIGSFLPARFQSAFILGAGAIATKPLVDMIIGPPLKQLGASAGVVAATDPTDPEHLHGISGWVSVDQAGRIGQLSGARGGMGAWITSAQMARGFRGLGNYSFDYGSPVTALRAYDSQPYAAAG